MAEPDYTTLTAIQDALKLVYGEGITNQFNDERTTYNQFPKSTRQPRGLGYEFSIRYQRAKGTGARQENAMLPPPLVGKFDKGKIFPRYIYGVLRLSGPAIEAAKGNVAAFVDGLSDSVDDLYQSIINDLNVMCQGDGFGKVAVLSADSDVLTTSGSTTWTVPVNNDLGANWVFEGMLVDFYTSGGAIDQSSVASRVSSVDVVNKTIEMEPNDGTYKAYHPNETARGYTIVAEAVPSGSIMVRMGSRAVPNFTTSDTPIEPTGLAGIFDDGTLLATFENIVVADYPKWAANIMDNSGTPRALTLDLMLGALQMVRLRSGKKVDLMRMGLGQRRSYANLLLDQVRFQPTELRGGYEMLTFAAGDGTVGMLIDPMNEPGRIMFEPNGVIQKYEMTPLGWGNLDQQMHWRSGYDQWDQFLRIYTNLGCEERNCLLLLSDLTEPAL